MKLTIYKKNTEKKEERVVISPSDNSTLTQAAMGEHVLSLSFVLPYFETFEVDDYVEFLGNTYTLIETPEPAMKSNQEWNYDLKFYGIEAELKRALVLKTVDKEFNPVFALTGKLSEHLAMIVENVNRIKETTDTWKRGDVTDGENIVMEYNGTSCYDALTQLANQLDTEWWVDGTTIKVGKCERENPAITLGYKKGLVNLNRNDNDNVKFFTRLYPIGGTRNIDRSKYGFSRLQLPAVNGKRPTSIDLETAAQFGIIEHFEDAAFAHIYPQRIGTITDVDDKEITNEDGETFKVYYFKDSGLNFNPKDYEIAGLTKHIVFQEAKELSGYDFEVNYEEGIFEIINQYDKGLPQLPGGNLVPKVGDKYILYNISMPDSYYVEAEKKFEEAVKEYLEDNTIDKAVYQGETDYIDIQNRQLDIKIGQKVKLSIPRGNTKNEEIRESRVTAITRNVNTPSKMTLTFSDVIAKGKMESMQQEIEKTMSFAKSNTLPDVVKSWETSPASDYNLYSSLKSVREFLSKNHRDTAQEEITFKKGIKLGKFDYGPLGTGGAILMDDNGNFRAEFDFFNIRKKATFTELEIKELKHIGGELIISPASMVCDRVEEVKILLNGRQEIVHRCYFNMTGPDGEKIMNQFQLNDQARCQTFNVENQGAESRYYWRLVVGTGENYIDLSGTTCDYNSDIPLPGDKIVQLGNRTDQDRQNAQILSAYGDDAPSFKQYTGINNFSLEDRCLTAFTSKGNWMRANYTLPDGGDVQSKVEMLEGYIHSEVSSIKKDFIGYDSYLHNSYFNDNLTGWETKGKVLLYTMGKKWVWINDNLFSDKKTYVGIIKDGNRTVLYIKDNFLKQYYKHFETHPLFEEEEREDKEGNKTTLFAPKIFNIGFNYKCIREGKLNIAFSDVTHKEEFHDFETIEVKDHPVAVTGEEEGYQQFSCSGYWNGQGDFNLSFDGEIYIYNLRLTENKLEYAEQKFSTKIEQTDKKINLLADLKQVMPNGDIKYLEGSITQSADSYEIKYTDTTNEEVNKASALRITSGGLCFVTYENGTPNQTDPLVTQTNIENGTIKIKAENIDFQGNIEANKFFKIHKDGSMEAAGAKITGEIHATKGSIGNWIIDNNISNDTVMLTNEGSIINRDLWALNKDGSGHLAKQNVTWDTDGNFRIKGILTTPFKISNSLGAILSDEPNLIMNVDKAFADDVGHYWNCYGEIKYDGSVIRVYNIGTWLAVRPHQGDGPAIPTRFVGIHQNTFQLNTGDYLEMTACVDPLNTSRVMWIITHHF
ncbi:MAG: hypothetical protein LIO93_06725 [Bacteroidales bacterium]|nr:hypothetical protein [Bacteroidales bacterium]